MDATPPAIIVVDGDTIRLGSERVRLINIDAPEMPAHAKCDAEANLALLAKDRIGEILRSGPLTVERHGRDRYGRTLAYLKVSGSDVGELLISGHYAFKWEGRRHSWCSR